MVTWRAVHLVLLAVTAVERLVEVRVSLRNTRWSLDHGGTEHGRAHYPAMVVLHTGFLIAAALEGARRRVRTPLALPMLAVSFACQGLRWWCIRSLGPRWNTRVFIVPGLPPETKGPYRWLRHPNYLAVVLEGVALPLVGGAWVTASVFTVLNALLLRTRLRVEEAALATLPPPETP